MDQTEIQKAIFGTTVSRFVDFLKNVLTTAPQATHASSPIMERFLGEKTTYLSRWMSVCGSPRLSSCNVDS